MTDPTQTLRKKLKALRQSMPEAERLLASEQIATLVTATIPSNARVASYVSTEFEVSTNKLHELLIEKDCEIYLPCIRDQQRLAFMPMPTNGLMVKNRFGIAEPPFSEDNALALNQFDYIIVPLLGFDAECNRLGMGGGYYDRALSGLSKPQTIGLGFDCQQTKLEPKPWDQPLDRVQTPSQRFERLR